MQVEGNKAPAQVDAEKERPTSESTPDCVLIQRKCKKHGSLLPRLLTVPLARAEEKKRSNPQKKIDVKLEN